MARRSSMKQSRATDNPSCLRCKRLSYLVGGVLLIVAAATSFFLDPIHIISRHKTRIENGSLYHEVLQRPDLPGADVMTYVFNITNPEEFLSGRDSKLKMEEVGPFTYREFRTNTNFEYDETLGVMRYSPKIVPRFVPEKSIGDPKKMNLTVPNIAMLAISSMISKASYFTKFGFNMLSKQLNSKPILTIDAESFLWGFEEPLIQFGHKVMPGVITFDKMGILDRLYDVPEFRLELGATQKDKFQIYKSNGEAGLTQLGYNTNPSRCNSFNDSYEGILYPTDITEETPLRLYRNVFCRIFNLQFRGRRRMDFGPEGFVYSFSDDSYNNNTDNMCLCKDDDCMNGVSDLSPCFFGLKFVLSNAHFLGTEPFLYERIEGMKPSEDLHGSEIVIDPRLGTVLGTRFTLQLNVEVGDVSFNSATQPFSDLIVPAAYFKIVQRELSDTNKHNLWMAYVVYPYILHTLELLFLLGGILLLTLFVRSFLPPPLHYDANTEESTQKEPLFEHKYKLNIFNSNNHTRS